jgi:hypothetical protein
MTLQATIAGKAYVLGDNVDTDQVSSADFFGTAADLKGNYLYRMAGAVLGIYGNTDYGTVRGVELIGERELRDWWGVRASYVFQTATATATNAFELLHRVHIDSLTRDTLPPGQVEFPLDFDRRHSVIVVLQARVTDSARVPARWLLRGLQAGVVARYSSGLPYSRTNTAGDTILGLPNGGRLPSQMTLDLLLRKAWSIGGRRAGVYIDVRNLLNRANVVSVRRDSGQPSATTTEVQALATAAYNAHPEPIPYESPRYRGWADLNHNGYVEGTTELMPLYLAAAHLWPLFAMALPGWRFGLRSCYKPDPGRSCDRTGVWAPQFDDFAARLTRCS